MVRAALSGGEWTWVICQGAGDMWQSVEARQIGMHGKWGQSLELLVTPHSHLGTGPRPYGSFGFLGCSLNSAHKSD